MSNTDVSATDLPAGSVVADDPSDEDAVIEAADDREARRTGGTFALKYLGPVTDQEAS